jgi:translation elongation factor EF-Tu-like GTPase
MTLESLKDKWKAEIDNWTVKNLKDEPEFMADCINYSDFAAYVLSVKPKIRSVKTPPVKFKRPAGIIGHTEVKSAQIEPEAVAVKEPVEKIPKAVQLYRDVVEEGKRRGFLE